MPEAQKDLSQGDVIDLTVVATVGYPAQRVAKQTITGGVAAWVESAVDSEFWIAKGTLRPVLVLTHSCDLDKKERRGRVAVAPIASADQLANPELRTAVFEQQRKSLMPLPNIPSLGDCYCDLRQIGMVDRRFLEERTKLASLSEEAVRRLHLQLVMFFTRA